MTINLNIYDIALLLAVIFLVFLFFSFFDIKRKCRACGSRWKYDCVRYTVYNIEGDRKANMALFVEYHRICLRCGNTMLIKKKAP